jgi:hypothetical protein
MANQKKGGLFQMAVGVAIFSITVLIVSYSWQKGKEMASSK